MWLRDVLEGGLVPPISPSHLCLLFVMKKSSTTGETYTPRLRPNMSMMSSLDAIEEILDIFYEDSVCKNIPPKALQIKRLTDLFSLVTHIKKKAKAIKKKPPVPHI